MTLGKFLSFAALSFLLAACRGGDNNGNSENVGSSEASGESGSQSAQLTIQGLIGEDIDGIASVVIKVGDTDYDAIVDSKAFSAEIKNAATDDLVSIVVHYPPTEERKEIILKSYVGDFSQIEARESEGFVSVNEFPALYINALSTTSAAFLEKVNEGDITTSDELLVASQVLPQEMLLESAVGLRYIVNGGDSSLFSHENTYDFIQDYPVAAKVALNLKSTPSVSGETYEQILEQFVSDDKQIVPVEGYSGEDFIFVTLHTYSERIQGLAVNLSGGSSGSGKFVDRYSSYEKNNSVSFEVTENITTLDVSELGRTSDFPDYCLNAESSIADLKSVRLIKYYDAAFYSAYKVDYAYSCQLQGEGGETVDFVLVDRFAQVNNQRVGSLEGISSSEFSILGFRDRSEYSNFSSVELWEPSIITPNENGTIDQRFDFLSDYVDSGVLSFNDVGNLIIESNRGVKVEYYTFGVDGAAIRTLGVLRREDGSLASIDGGYATPVVRGTEIPVPSDIFNYGGIFDPLDPELPNYYEQFGLRYYTDGSGIQVSKGNDYITEYASSLFGWSDKGDFREHRYFVDNVEFEVYSSCSGDNVNCVEWRYREVEPLFFDGTFYYLRVYQEMDSCKRNGDESCLGASGYIDRWKLSAIQ
ncbi:hypothetical protein ACJJIF_15630 [Microbulbifer sp. SSSA002]|uniref:hypothetical protein n=1 Tax=Microbulbifer sp. SSSA002 TaxID=3243376 RepID=UPI004039B708